MEGKEGAGAPPALAVEDLQPKAQNSAELPLQARETPAPKVLALGEVTLVVRDEEEKRYTYAIKRTEDITPELAAHEQALAKINAAKDVEIARANGAAMVAKADAEHVKPAKIGARLGWAVISSTVGLAIWAGVERQWSVVITALVTLGGVELVRSWRKKSKEHD